MEKKSGGLAIASLVLGIISILVCFIPIINVISYIFGFLSLIFAIISLCKKSGKGLCIASIILVVISLYIATNMNKAASNALNDASKELEKTSKELDKSLGNSTEQVLKEDVEVNLGTLSITTDEYGFSDTEMLVTVKNITNKQQSYNFHIEAVDASGSRIDEDYVYVNNLGPGQTTTEKIFTYISDDKIDAMRTATFKIIEASVY